MTHLAALVALVALAVFAQPSPGATPPEVSLPDTEQRVLHSKLLKRSYPLYISLPSDYAAHPERRYPVLLLADGPYAFPVVRAIIGRVADGGQVWREPIIVGLGYALGEHRIDSRRRDYTPTPHGDVDATPAAPGARVVYGAAEPYRQHLAREVLPFVAQHYRADLTDVTYAGHSYGGLLGAHILLTSPALFRRYILLSPSLWYGAGVTLARERARALTHRDLPADVYLAIGSLETTAEPSILPTADANYDMVGDMDAFARSLCARHYPGLRVTEEILPGEDHMTVYPAVITHALQWAYGRTPPAHGTQLCAPATSTPVTTPASAP